MVLHCELNKPASSVEWRKEGEGELLKNGDKYQMRKKDLQVELKIVDLTVEDSGGYSCICGEQRTSAHISVNGEHFCVVCFGSDKKPCLIKTLNFNFVDMHVQVLRTHFTSKTICKHYS